MAVSDVGVLFFFAQMRHRLFRINTYFDFSHHTLFQTEHSVLETESVCPHVQMW